MDLSYLNDLEANDFYEAIMDLPENRIVREIRIDNNIVHGCQSKVWLALIEGKILFDSDSLFVKGLLTAVVSQINSIDEMQKVSLEDYNSFINLDKITYQRIKGIDSFLTRLNALATINNSRG
jgi:sulfur transfer protein SufE